MAELDTMLVLRRDYESMLREIQILRKAYSIKTVGFESNDDWVLDSAAAFLNHYDQEKEWQRNL